MNITLEVLLVMIIGLLASATDTDLTNNTNFLLLLLLVLASQGNVCDTCCTNPCGNRTSFFV